MEQSQASTAVPHHAPAANKWLVALAVMLATIVEVLDMTIANVALDHIRGNLSAGVDEAAWVMTSYIVGNAIVIPLTGWLSSVFGRKRFFLFCIALFTTSSLLCGSAPNLLTLVFFRVLQGLSGGAMMPLSQAILMETFPTEEQGTAMAVWGTGMMVAPILGPLLGGWITDNYSWRWIFYINAPVGLIASLLVTLILVDPPTSSARSSAPIGWDSPSWSWGWAVCKSCWIRERGKIGSTLSSSSPWLFFLLSVCSCLSGRSCGPKSRW